jgi:uncharacterized membrane protein
MIERVAIGALAVIGLLISAYFAAIYHKLAPSIDRFIPGFCRIEPATCTSVLQSPQARLFGIPNFDLGILYYTGLLGTSVLPTLWKQLFGVVFLGSIITVLTGFYLSYVLVFRLRIRCRLCFLSHAVNLLIFFFLMATL